MAVKKSKAVKKKAAPKKKKVVSKKKKAAPKKKSTGVKKAFGGYAICFKGCSDTLEKVFGTKPLGPSQMTKAIWVYIKKKRIAGK